MTLRAFFATLAPHASAGEQPHVKDEIASAKEHRLAMTYKYKEA